LTFCGGIQTWQWEEGEVVTIDTTITAADLSGKKLGPAGAQILAAFMSTKLFQDKGSLSKLDISGNRICGLDKDGHGTYDTSGFAALAKSIGNLKELSISSNFLRAEGARILVPALEANGSLSSLTFCGGVPMHMDGSGWIQGGPVTINTTVTEADFSGKNLGSAGAQILVAFMTRKFFQDKGSLSKLDISGTQICGLDERGNGTYDASGLAALAKSIGNLKELSISSNCLKAEGAKILAPALEANGSLASLTISNNKIGSEQQAKIKEICAGKSIKCTL
jgi:hypothetical protein